MKCMICHVFLEADSKHSTICDVCGEQFGEDIIKRCNY